MNGDPPKKDNQESANPSRSLHKRPSHLVHDAYSRAASISQHYAPLLPTAAPGSAATQKTATGSVHPSGVRQGRGKRSLPHAPLADDVIGPRDEIIFEFAPRGQFMQVTAMHAPTLTEVTVVGSVQASEREMEQLALAKLRFVLRKKQTGKS